MKIVHSRTHRTTGFTLIELMIAVAIVAILAVIALPAYTQHVMKARRAAAQSFMMDAANREEQMLLDLRSYVAVASNAKFPDAPPTGLNMAVPSSGGDVNVSSFYNLVITITATPPGYTITATPTGAQLNDKASGTACSPLTLSSTGAKSPPACW